MSLEQRLGTGSERSSQRLALRVIFVVLGLLALALGVRGGGPDDTPATPAPSPTASP